MRTVVYLLLSCWCHCSTRKKIVTSKRVSNCKNTSQQKVFSQSNETLSDFFMNIIVRLDWQNIKLYCAIPVHQFFREIKSWRKYKSLEQIIQRNATDRIMEKYHIVVMTVESWVLDAVLVAMENEVKPRIKMTVRSIQGCQDADQPVRFINHREHETKLLPWGLLAE